VWGRFLAVEKPVIAAMHGYVLGSGIEMSLCCDIRICSDDARFGLPEPGLGIIPAAGGSQTLPRVVGIAPSLEMLMSGRWLTAEEACRIKLVNRVVPREDLITEAEKIARKIRSNDTLAVRYAKQAVTRGLDLDMKSGLELEARLGRRLISRHKVEK
jgi:enoyl-CoA hydratase